MIGLVGNTGFVGTNLENSISFDCSFNSSNIESIKGKEFDLLICAAAPGSMIYANSNGQEDLSGIKALLVNLKKCKAKRFVLISTIAVFRDFSEGNSEESLEFEPQLDYGVNRRFLELELGACFDNVHILRLPSLIGLGLKKNFLFDLLNPMPSFLRKDRLSLVLETIPFKDRDAIAKCFWRKDLNNFHYLDREIYSHYTNKKAIEERLHENGLSSIFFHSHKSSYQFYNLTALWDDILMIIRSGVELVHLASPPVSVSEVHRYICGYPMPETKVNVHYEDLRTKHAALWSSPNPYIQTVDSSLAEIKIFTKNLEYCK